MDTTRVLGSPPKPRVVSVERIKDPAAFEALREEWDALLEASPSQCLFLTWEWLYTWWKHLGGDRSLCIITARSGDELVAIAPFALRQWRVGPLSFRALGFLGAGSVGSDYLDVIVRRGREREAVRALAEYLVRERFVLELTRVKRSSYAVDLAAELAGQGWSLSETTTDLCPFITLSGHSWESYLATLGSEHRYNFHRRFRNATKQFGLRFTQAGSASQRRDALAVLVALHHQRWRERGGSDGLQTPALLAFHEDVSQRALDRGWLRLFVLSLQGEPAASVYGFRYRQGFAFYQAGFDPRFGKHSVGLIAMGLAIKSAIEEGADEYDLLHGNEPYKSHWAKEARELVRLELYPPGAGEWLYRRAWGMGRAAKRMVRRALPNRVGDRIAAIRRVGVWGRLG